MSKFPHLDQLRAEIERNEEELTAPYKRQIQIAAAMIADLRQKAATVQLAEAYLASDIKRYVAEGIADSLAREIYKQVEQKNLPYYNENAVAKLQARFVPRDALAFEQSVVVVEATIPPLRIRSMITEDALHASSRK